MNTTETVPIAISVRGDIAPGEKAYAKEKVANVMRLATAPVLYAAVDLLAERDPGRDRPAVAEAGLDVDGRPVRVKVAAGTMHEAIDLLEARLRRRIEHVSGRNLDTLRRLHRDDPHEWHHGDLPTQRPPYFDRPVEEREVVRHKSFAAPAQTPAQAALDMDLLDHDFFLFTNEATGEDNVIFRTEDDRYALAEPTPTATELPWCIESSLLRPTPLPLDQAVDLLDLGDEPFVFFLDPRSGRGRVLYRRYDGHYGLITPASE